MRYFFAHHYYEAWWVHLAERIKEQKWLLLLIAFAPALAADLYGIASMLELKRMERNSACTAQQLKEAKAALKKLEGHPDVLTLRALAMNVAMDIYQEHGENWAQTMSANELGVPA